MAGRHLHLYSDHSPQAFLHVLAGSPPTSCPDVSRPGAPFGSFPSSGDFPHVMPDVVAAALSISADCWRGFAVYRTGPFCPAPSTPRPEEIAMPTVWIWKAGAFCVFDGSPTPPRLRRAICLTPDSVLIAKPRPALTSATEDGRRIP